MNDLKNAEILFNIGDEYYRKTDFANAEKSYLEAARIVKSIRGNDDLEMANIYHRLCGLYWRIDKPDKAFINNENRIQILKHHYGDYHPALAMPYMSMANEKVAVNRYDIAEQYLWHANNCLISHIDDLERKMLELFYSLQCMLSYVCLVNRKAEEAKKIIVTAAINAEERFGDSDPSYAACLAHLAIFYRYTADTDSSRRLNQKALNRYANLVNTDTSGDNSTSVFIHPSAAVSNNYGVLCIDTTDYSKAEMLCKLAFDIVSQYNDGYSAWVISGNLCSVYHHLGDTGKYLDINQWRNTLHLKKLDVDIGEKYVVFDKL